MEELDAASLPPSFAFLVRLLEQYTPLVQRNPSLDRPELTKIIRLVYLIRLYVRQTMDCPLKVTNIAAANSPSSSETDEGLPQTVDKPLYKSLVLSRLEKWTFTGAQKSRASDTSDKTPSISPRTSVNVQLPWETNVSSPQVPNDPIEAEPALPRSTSTLDEIHAGTHASSTYTTAEDDTAENDTEDIFKAKMNIYLIFIAVEMEQALKALDQLEKVESPQISSDLRKTVRVRCSEATRLAEEALAVINRQVRRDLDEGGSGLPELHDYLGALIID